ncbi:phosphopantetheine adenylyltransferase [Cutibacterium acnes JCM 18909]|nr:phosphopantetheine adenylyltransferase [Cutibacterium acnes JCM 18909]
MKVVFSGSFDPITLGHVDIVTRAAELVDEVVVGVAMNSAKNGIFSMDERVAFVKDAVADIPGVEVALVDGLLVDFCTEMGADAIIRGLRFGGDFDYELQMAHLNKAMSGIETILLPAGREFGTISSSMIRSAACNGGNVSEFVPEMVNAALHEKNSRINDFFRYWRTLLTPFRFGGYGRVITVPVALPSTDFRKALATSADFTAGKPGKNSS